MLSIVSQDIPFLDLGLDVLLKVNGFDNGLPELLRPRLAKTTWTRFAQVAMRILACAYHTFTLKLALCCSCEQVFAALVCIEQMPVYYGVNHRKGPRFMCVALACQRKRALLCSG